MVVVNQTEKVPCFLVFLIEKFANGKMCVSFPNSLKKRADFLSDCKA